MTKAEKKLRKAMRQLDKACAEMSAELGLAYSGRDSACRIPHKGADTCYNVFGYDPYGFDYTFYQKED